MNSLYGSKKITNVCSGNVVFRNTKDVNGELISLKQYIDKEYNRRVLYLRDMVLAKKQIPFLASATFSTGTNILSVTFSEIVYKNVYNDYTDWGEINGSIISNNSNNTNTISINDLDHTVWDINIENIENIIGSTYTIPANSFQNRFGNVNQSVSMTVTS